MKKKFKMDELPAELQTLVDQYIKAKQSLYGYDEKTLDKKAKHLYENIRSITVTSKLTGLVKGYYKTNTKTLTISEATWLNGLDKETFIHELNHAWNTDKNRVNIVPRKWKKEKKIRYNTLNEVINEAETQILIGKNNPNNETIRPFGAANLIGITSTSESGSVLKAPGRFHCYSDVECLFETLATVSNSTHIEFLKAIEGKDIEGIAEFMAGKTGLTKNRMMEYLDIIAENTSVNKNNKDKKIEERFQEIYDESSRLIEESTLGEEIKRESQEKLSCTQDRLLLTSGVYHNFIEREKEGEPKKARRLKLSSEEEREKLKIIKERVQSGEISGVEKFLSKARNIIKHPEYSKKYSPFMQPDWGDKEVKKINIEKSGKILLLDHSVDDRNIFRKISDRLKDRNVPRIAVARPAELRPPCMSRENMLKLAEVNTTEYIENYYIESEQVVAVDSQSLNQTEIDDTELF